jgi:hypothetical protein
MTCFLTLIVGGDGEEAAVKSTALALLYSLWKLAKSHCAFGRTCTLPAFS